MKKKKKKKKKVGWKPVLWVCPKTKLGGFPFVFFLLPRQSDPPLPSLCLSAAYRCYAHYLKIEVSQSHPVMKAFCGLLLQSVGQESNTAQRSRDAEEGR